MTTNPKPVDRAKLYPMWCVDLGEDQLDDRFSGPFPTVREAVDSQQEYAKLFDDGGEVRRCRSQKPSEIVSDWGVAAEWLRDYLDDQAMNGSDSAWGDWEEPRVAIRDDAAAARGLAAWADKHLVTHTYICEGDEQVDGLVLDVPPAPDKPDYESLLAAHAETAEQLALIEQDAVLGMSEVDALIEEVEELRADLDAAKNAADAWRMSYQEAYEELSVVWRRGLGGSSRALAEAGWHLALFVRSGLTEGRAVTISHANIIDTITAGAYALSRAEALRDQAVGKADRLREEKLEAERQRDAVARELGRALVRIEELEAERAR